MLQHKERLEVEARTEVVVAILARLGVKCMVLVFRGCERSSGCSMSGNAGMD